MISLLGGTNKTAPQIFLREFGELFYPRSLARGALDDTRSAVEFWARLAILVKSPVRLTLFPGLGARLLIY